MEYIVWNTLYGIHCMVYISKSLDESKETMCTGDRSVHRQIHTAAATGGPTLFWTRISDATTVTPLEWLYPDGPTKTIPAKLAFSIRLRQTVRSTDAAELCQPATQNLVTQTQVD